MGTPLLLLIPGVAAVLLVLAILFFIFRASFSTIDVRKHGMSVSATVTRIEAEFVWRIMRAHSTSYVIHADWEDPRTHKLYHFKSKAGSVRVPLRHPTGSQVDVLIDPKNPRRYAVVLEFDEQSIV